VSATDPRRLVELHALLEDWAIRWRVPLLAKRVRIRTSTRMRRTLGTYRHSSAQITLAAWLLDEAPRVLLEEVLCHEAAHAAVHLAHEAHEASGGHAPSASLGAPAGSASNHFGAGETAPISASTLSPFARLRARLARRGRMRARSSRDDSRDRPIDPARIRPHGPEWRAFMESAGHPARVRIPEALMPPAVRAATAAGRCWEHRCPVCQATRMARTRVARWRCKRCVEAGRGGRLVIARVEGVARFETI